MHGDRYAVAIQQDLLTREDLCAESPNPAGPEKRFKQEGRKEDCNRQKGGPQQVGTGATSNQKGTFKKGQGGKTKENNGPKTAPHRHVLSRPILFRPRPRTCGHGCTRRKLCRLLILQYVILLQQSQ